MIHIDQLRRKLNITTTPKRIVSLVPSQTELLVSLGLTDAIVGVTKFCVHPETIKKQKTIVGGTKNLKLDVIRKLNPDIILCNKEENTKDMVMQLQDDYPVHVSDIFSIQDAIDLIKQYGVLFEKEPSSNSLIAKIEREKESFAEFMMDKAQRHVAYFIWKDPWMAVGKNTFIDHVLKINSFINVFGSRERYPEVNNVDLASLEKLDLILLSSEPFPFSEKHIDEVKKMAPHAKIVLVDGEYFSWYGSRLVEAFAYFRTLH